MSRRRCDDNMKNMQPFLRTFLRVSVSAATGLFPAGKRWLAGAVPALVLATAHAAPAALTDAQARHLLLRTGFAPTQGQVDPLLGRSAQQAVDDILKRAKASRPLHAAPAFTGEPPPPPRGQMATREEQQAARQQQNKEAGDLKNWWLREMIDSPAPLAERMTLFWHGHFATSQQKVIRSQGMWNQHQLFRSEALGNFRTLLHGVAKDPAMLVYLDGANSRKEAPNENFAREVMELFTLGEASGGGGYTEQDIREAARAFTGFSVDRETFSFRMRPAFHDTGNKTLFGRTGNLDGDAALELMLEQPNAARFITAKLWREFVSPAPDGSELDRIAGRFRASGYDISAVLRELLLSDAFWTDAQRGSLVKSPVELVVGTVRQFEFDSADTQPLVQKSAQLGQNLLVPPNVKGWPGYTEWINSTTLLERKRFTEQLFRVAPNMAANAAQPAFDADKFLAVYGGHADREPSPQVQARLLQAVLPIAPTQNVAAGTVGVMWLKALTQDAAYQLK